MIPMIGCRVKVLAGKHAGKEGTVTEVTDGRAFLQSMSEHEAKLFVKGRRATYGEDWMDKFYQAKVDVDGAKGPPLLVTTRAQIQILTPDLVRPSTYRVV